MSTTTIPYRHVPSLQPQNPARLPLVEIRRTRSTECTGPDGDLACNRCLCYWSPWFDMYGRPEDGPDPHYEPLIGDPLADLPVAEPWRPRRRRALAGAAATERDTAREDRDA